MKKIGTFTKASETFGQRGFFSSGASRFTSCEEEALHSANNVYGKKDRFGTLFAAEADECAKAASKIVVQLPEYPTFTGGQFQGKV